VVAVPYTAPTSGLPAKKEQQQINVVEILPAMKRGNPVSAADKLSLNNGVKMC